MKTPQPPPGPAAELYARVQAATEGTPYAVTLTPNGFDVTVDIDVPQWRTLLYSEKVQKVFTYHVSVDGQNKKIAITDELYELEWSAGVGSSGLGQIPVPHLRASASKQYGRIWHKSSYKTMEIGHDESSDAVRQYKFSSEEGRRLIREPAKELGWTEVRGRTEKIGIVVAIIGGVGAVVALLVTAIVLVLGG